MRYTPRDLRAADMLALILVGLGVALLAVGIIQFVAGRQPRSTLMVPSSEMTSSSISVGKSKDGGLLSEPGVRVAVAGFVLGCLGAALCFKVRQLIRTNGVEPAEYGRTAKESAER